MDLEEIRARLVPFCRAMLDDPAADVSSVTTTDGHAGFSYFFEVARPSGRESYFLRLPPPGVKWEGTADVLRQVSAVNSLEGSGVPHAPIRWSGDDAGWFGSPYFVAPRLDGNVLRGEWLAQFNPEHGTAMGKQAMAALAAIHKVDWRSRCSYLGEFWGFEFDVSRWDRFAERAAEPQLLSLQPRVRDLLLERIPADTNIGLYHGDFQWSNLLYSAEARLLAVIDWELTGIGATLNDLGWICVFNDPTAWAHANATPTAGVMPGADALEAMYVEAWGSDPGDIAWFKALAAYKFGTITGFNLMLHRRGKRHDPHWEDLAPSMQSNMEYALRMLTG